MIKRQLSASLARSNKSLLLLGPRQTGKSTLFSNFNPALTFNLAQEATFLEFLRNAQFLEQSIEGLHGSKIIFIDEIQRLPNLLNTIQVILDRPKNNFRFLLTGSSARKLKRGNANLLPGRIHSYFLGPLTSGEMSYAINTSLALSIGTLPGIWTEPDSYSREKTLKSYAATYLKEEIQAENLARNLEGFARFLHISAEWSATFLDLSKLSSLAQVARQSAVRFFEILEDSLIVFRLEPFSNSLSRRLVQHPKYYFFDVGVLNGLLGNFNVSADRIGRLFEHLVVSQVFHGFHHIDQDVRLSSYRTEHGAEVDLIVESQGDIFAIEIKASKNVGSNDLRGFKSFSEIVKKKHKSFVFYLGPHKRIIDGVLILPWQEGLKAIGL